jgi:hypothetical protein
MAESLPSYTIAKAGLQVQEPAFAIVDNFPPCLGEINRLSDDRQRLANHTGPFAHLNQVGAL